MSEIYLEVLDDAPNEVREFSDTSVPTLEITVHKEVTVYELAVQEFLEISELGPSGSDGFTVLPPYTGVQVVFGPGPLPTPGSMPNTIYCVMPDSV